MAKPRKGCWRYLFPCQLAECYFWCPDQEHRGAPFGFRASAWLWSRPIVTRSTQRHAIVCKATDRAVAGAPRVSQARVAAFYWPPFSRATIGQGDVTLA
jgi:hypothetical protein